MLLDRCPTAPELVRQVEVDSLVILVGLVVLAEVVHHLLLEFLVLSELLEVCSGKGDHLLGVDFEAFFSESVVEVLVHLFFVVQPRLFEARLGKGEEVHVGHAQLLLVAVVAIGQRARASEVQAEVAAGSWSLNCGWFARGVLAVGWLNRLAWWPFWVGRLLLLLSPESVTGSLAVREDLLECLAGRNLGWRRLRHSLLTQFILAVALHLVLVLASPWLRTRTLVRVHNLVRAFSFDHTTQRLSLIGQLMILWVGMSIGMVAVGCIIT